MPILLGMFILGARIAGAERLCAIIFVIVLVSVVLQGGLVPLFARVFRVPTDLIEPQPWAPGFRFRERSDGLSEFVVAPRSPADGTTIDA